MSGSENQELLDSAVVEESRLQRIADRVQSVRQRIPEHVRLVAVTKTFAPEVVRAAYATGLRDFAENKVQESLEKQAALEDLEDITWHFIGHIQSNKSRKVLEHFDWIHSVDSVKLAARLNRQAAELGKCPNCCLQVKMADDPTKSGFEIDELLAAVHDLDALENIRLCGLMAIAPYGLPPQENRQIFDKARQLAEKINQMGCDRLQMNTLSMGMSGDFELAIAAGATMVRIGSGLFGKR